VILATGTTYSVTDNLQLDAGVNFGVTEASDRVNPFEVVSQRF
jgi:long-subunit fatty acid transport protein